MDTELPVVPEQRSADVNEWDKWTWLWEPAVGQAHDI